MIVFWLRAALGWLKGLPWQVYATIGAGVAVLLLWHVHGVAERSAYNSAFNTGFSAAAKQFNDAQAKADTTARAIVVTNIAAQAAISKDSTDALAQTDDDIDRRAAAIKLRHDASVRSATGPDHSDATGALAGGSCPAPAQDGLAWDVAYPLMVLAAKNDAQLNAVLDWEASQDALDAAQ